LTRVSSDVGDLALVRARREPWADGAAAVEILALGEVEYRKANPVLIVPSLASDIAAI
jgi:hypothetical protein